jgi:tetratricopeptide (TPR) repeat protein
MLQDAQGLNISTDAPNVVEAINRFTAQLISYGNQADVIFKAVEAEPTNVLANAYAATLCLLAETAIAPQHAAPYLQTAQAHLSTATEREILYVQAIAAWAQGDIDQALQGHERLTDRYPRDLVALLIGQYHYFYLGKNYHLLRLIEKVFPANRENHYLYGMLAFALEQCHRLIEAETAGRQAVAMNRCDPWAHHAIAHVMETQGRFAEGIVWMESLADTWEHCGSFFCHNWWHVALFYLEKGDIPNVLELYDTHVWGRAIQTYSQCHLDAISLLLRLELAGSAMGEPMREILHERWQALGRCLSDRIHDHIFPLIDVQYVYALERSGQPDQADELINSLRCYATKVHPIQQYTWATVALPTAQGMVAHAKGRWTEAIAYLEVAYPHFQTIGGSHPQRDLLQLVYLDALLQAGECILARDLLTRRVLQRGQTPVIQAQLLRTH